MLNPRQFEDLKKYVAEFNAVGLKGELEAEYKRLSGLIAEWDKRQNLAKAASDLQAAKTALIAERDAFTKQKAAGETKLTAWEAGLKKREADLEARIKAHNTESDTLAAAKIAHDTTAAAAKKALSAQSAMLEQKAKDLENLQGSLHQRGVDLSKREDKVKDIFSYINTVLKG